MNRSLLKIFLLAVTLVSFAGAQSLADLKSLLDRLDRKIRIVEQLAVRYQNDKATELVQLAKRNYREAISYLQQGRFNRAKMAYVRALKQVEWAAQIVLYKPAARANQRLNELMRRAEQAVNLSANEDARYMLSKARAFQMKAEQAFNQERYVESQQYYRVATYFARKAMDLATIGTRPVTQTDFEQYYKNLMNLFKNIPRYEENSEYSTLLKKARTFMKKARELYEKKDTKQAFMYLQISERMLHRAVDLSQSTSAGRKENIRANLQSLRRYLDGIEQTLGQSDDQNARRLLQKANQYLRAAWRDFENGNYRAAQNKTMLIQRMAAKALKYTVDTESGSDQRLKARLDETDKLLELRKQNINAKDADAAVYLLDQAGILLSQARRAYESGREREAFTKLQLALRLINQSKLLAGADTSAGKEELLRRYNQLSATLSSLEEHTGDRPESVVPALRRMLEKAKENLDSGRLNEAARIIRVVENQIDFILKDVIK